jgi:beta-lactam-binding protein with PASTA domain
MIAIYVVIGLVFILLLVQQARALYRRSALPSVERYHRAMDALGGMSGNIRVLDSPAPPDAEAPQGPSGRPTVATPSDRASPAAKARLVPVRNEVTTLGTARLRRLDDIALEPFDANAPPAPGQPQPTGFANGRVRLYGAVILGVVLGGTLVGVLVTSSSPAPHLAAGPKPSHHASGALSPRGPISETSPNLVGLTEGNAEALLSSSGLRWRLVKVASTDPAAVGIVLAQAPVSSHTVRQGSVVSLSIGEPYPSARVPNVSSPPESAQLAESAIRKAGFTPKTRAAKATTLHELGLQGKVLSEVPSAGSRKPKHSTVVITLVEGAATEMVPDGVVGETPARAGATLASAQLVVGTTRNASSSSVPAGEVAGTYPSTPGELAPVGSTVNLVVSTGAIERVPDLEGDTVAEARHALKTSGLRLGQVRSGAGPNGRVVAQAAKPGRQLAKGTPIAIVVGVTPLATNTTSNPGAGDSGT